MSRVLVIPDVHLKPWIFDMADRVDENSYDDIVILGDLVDDWGKGNDLDAYNETLDRAAEFGKEHDQSLWCYGNHDVSYLWDAMESGYSVQARINRMGKQELWRDNSPIWARPQVDFYRMFRDDLFYQVVGHTPVEEPLDLGGVLTLDLFSTYSNGDPYGNQKIYIVDTETRKYIEAL